MITASSAFMEKVNNGEIPLMRMQLTTAAGRVIWLQDGQFWGDSISFGEATAQDGSFTVGSAVIGSFNFSLTNFDRSLDDIDFAGAVVIPFLYYVIDDSPEYLPKGIYYINSHKTTGNIIQCTALDGMKFFDNAQTAITYPITVQNLISTICTANNIALATQTIPNGSTVLQKPTESEGTTLTDRQMLSYACQITGNFAKMNENGALVVGWYDFENPIEVVSTFSGKSLWTKPIHVTGIRISAASSTDTLMSLSIDPNGNLIYTRTDNVTDTFAIDSSDSLLAFVTSGATYTLVNEQVRRTGEPFPEPSEADASSVSILYGTDENVIKIENNPYVTTSNILSICRVVSEQVFLDGFRPGSIPILSNPCMQAGDVLHITDSFTGDDYYFPVATLNYAKTVTENVECPFETKEDADLRPSTSYNMRQSVEAAMRQAIAADELAQRVEEMAEKSGYQLFITSEKGTAFMSDTTTEITGTIYDRDMNLIDPYGTEFIIRWWYVQDGTSAKYLNGGKTITVAVNDSLCDFTAGIYFENIPIDEGVNPFSLCDRLEYVLTDRNGLPLTARAAEEYVE